MKGYNGKILNVDLTTGTFDTLALSEYQLKSNLGGRGFIVPELISRIPAGADPLGPENCLIFALGPFTGYLPGGGRNSVGAMSPLTSGFGESEAGGHFGAELKRAGLDGILITGRAPQPVYLWIDNGVPELREAVDLWGMQTADTQAAIQTALGSTKIRTAVIGPAGENRVRFASIHNDITHVYGRNGMGAVMGSKKLKAIAVRGKRLPPVANKKGLVALSRTMAKRYKKSPLSTCGTGLSLEYFHKKGNLPIRNFNGGELAEVDKISAGALCKEGLLVEMHSCFACPIRCKKRVMAQSPWPIDPVYGGPEYETLAALGSNCGVDDVQAIAKGHELCNRFGIDTISTGVTLSFAMECFENGLIDTSDTNGLELCFGNADAMLKMITQIASHEGFGAVLAQGSRRAAQTIGKGAEKYAMQVKGLELPMHEPRHNQSFAIHYTLHGAGPDHCTGSFEDSDSHAVGKFVIEGRTPSIEKIAPGELSPEKTKFLYTVGLYRNLCNHLGVCLFLPWKLSEFFEALEAITGWAPSYHDLRMAVDRSLTLARLFNLRQDLDHTQDTLPERFFTPASEGPLQTKSVDPLKLKEAQQAFFDLMQWDQNGVPTAKALTDLKIEEYATQIQTTQQGAENGSL